MYLLIPGRHALLTQFQFHYLQKIIQEGLALQKDIFGNLLSNGGNVEAVIFAVTSANHSNTRRNPVPFYLRAISIEALGNSLAVPLYIYGIDDVGTLPNFAAYTLKRINHDSDGLFNCTPHNTIVICSTQVLHMYLQLGFRVLPAELSDIQTWYYHSPLPWDVVEHIAHRTESLQEDRYLQQHMHPASMEVWKKYQLAKKLQLLFKDAMISSDGDLTETRDYNVYVRQMDDIAELKFKETLALVLPGRIGDIGCAVGSWLKQAAKETRLRESDLYGIEVSRHLYEICRQRKENGEFENPFVFFSQKNAVTGLVFDRQSMNTIHSSSLTHEIESYGSRRDLLQFIKNRYEELCAGGVWINRDVVGPYKKDTAVLLWLNREDGENTDPLINFNNRQELAVYLQSLSTYSRFLRFARDFRRKEGFQLSFVPLEKNGETYFQLSLKNACEFLSRKDYCDNWESEMHETFCYWDFDEWKQQLLDAGFSIHPSSHAFTNHWIVANRWQDKVALFDLALQPLEWPATNMILAGIREQ